MRFLTRELAQTIVQRTMEILKTNINVMDRNGVIIGSGDLKRIGTVHLGAVEAIQKGVCIEITEDQARDLPGTKSGINQPFKFQGEIVGVIGITGDPEKVRQYAQLVQMTAELILEQSVLIEQLRWDERLRENFVLRLINSEANFDPLFFEQAKMLKIDLDLPRVAIVIVNHEQQEIFHIIKDFIDPDDLYTITFQYVVVFKQIYKRNDTWDYQKIKEQMVKLKDWARDMFSIKLQMGLGRYYPGIDGFYQSFQEAKNTLEVGLKIHPEKNVYFYNDYHLDVFLMQASSVTKISDLVKPYQKLRKYEKQGELTKTLETFIQEGQNMNQVAEKLYIHRNTIYYRFDVIKELTGKDPRNTQDLLDLYISMKLYQISSRE